MKGLELPDIAPFVCRGLGLEACVVVGLSVIEHEAPTPDEKGRLGTHVGASSWSASGPGPHFFELALALRRIADALDRRAREAGYTYDEQARVAVDLHGHRGGAPS